MGISQLRALNRDVFVVFSISILNSLLFYIIHQMHMHTHTHTQKFWDKLIIEFEAVTRFHTDYCFVVFTFS